MIKRHELMPALPLFLAATGLANVWAVSVYWLGLPFWTLYVLAVLVVPAVPVYMTVRRRVKVRYWQAKGRRQFEATAR